MRNLNVKNYSISDNERILNKKRIFNEKRVKEIETIKYRKNNEENLSLI